VPNPQPAAIPLQQSPLSIFFFFLSTTASKSRDYFLSEFISHNLQSFSTSICRRAATT
jgi:hypothetical protein